MTKSMKITSITLLALILLFIFGASILNVLVSPNFMREKITGLVSEKIHRKIDIKGDLSWSFFPRLKINASKIELGNPTDFVPNTVPFLQAEQLHLGLNIWKLFAGKIEINYLALKGLKINLMTNEQGKKNWEIAPPPIKNHDNSNNQKKLSNSSLDLNIGGIFVSNSDIVFQDLSKKQIYSLSNLNINASHIQANTPFNLTVSTRFDAGQNKTGQINFSTEALFDSQWKQIQIAHFQSENQINFPNLKPFSFTLLGSLIADNEKKHLSLTDFDGKLDTLHFTGNIESDYQNSNSPTVIANLNIDSFNLKRLMALFNQTAPNFKNPNALTNVSANVTLQATPNSLQINNLRAALDNSTLSGNVALPDLNKKLFQFDLHINQINLDDYQIQPAIVIANNSTQTATVNTPATSPTSSNSLLNQITGKGSLAIDTFSSNKITFSNAHANINAAQGIFTINPISMSVFEGKYLGQTTYNNLTSQISQKGSFTGIQAQNLMQQLSPITKIQVTGQADVNLTLTTQGRDQNNVLKNLNGNVLFIFKNGVLQGVDLAYYYRLGKTLLSKQSGSDLQNTHQTSFGNLSGTFDITQGVASSKDFLLQGPLFNAAGTGTADLVNEQINFQLQITSSAINDQTIPLIIKGPFAKPMIYPDVQQIAKTQLKQQVKKQIQGNVSNLLEKSLGKASSDAVVNQLNTLISN